MNANQLIDQNQQHHVNNFSNVINSNSVVNGSSAWNTSSLSEPFASTNYVNNFGHGSRPNNNYYQQPSQQQTDTKQTVSDGTGPSKEEYSESFLNFLQLG